MACFSNMPRVILQLLLLILSPPFIHQARNLAAADYNLIQTLCHNSDTPETCMRCVQSDKDGNKADTVGIATIVLNCINNQGKTLEGNFSILASTSSDKKMKPLYQKCAQNYELAKKMLTSAKQDLQNHQYDNAEFSVVKALNFGFVCHDKINGYQNDVPGHVFYDMKIYEELSEAACRIIEKIYV